MKLICHVMFGTLRKGFEFLCSCLFRRDSERITYISLLMAVSPKLNLTFGSSFMLVVVDKSCEKYPSGDPMKHIVKIMSLMVALSAVWISLLQMSVLPASYTWLLPLYFIVSLGCYGLLMVGVGLMNFPTCPHEAILLQQDVLEAKEFLRGNGVDVGTD